ncbi:MAG: zf-HC2 domain-containing protein [Anaerolineae bacterium]|nr:zf-HC2 domain-containing protein [Anaerolineae bacterium]
MMSNAHVEFDLLPYLDGELSAAECARVEAHLATCPVCREELETLRVLRQGLASTFDAALASVHLPHHAEARIRDALRERAARPRWWWSLRLNWGLAAQAALALLVVFFSLNLWPWLSAPPPVIAQETLVLGQNRLAPGSAAALRVVVRERATATPVAGAEVAVSIGKAPGLAREVYRGMTGADGTAAVAFTVPADLEGAAELRIETHSDVGSEVLVRPITVVRAYRVLLMPDKPAYRPGQSVLLRALVLDTVTLRPVSGVSVNFWLQEAQGQIWASDECSSSDMGIAFTELFLPETAATGRGILRAVVGDTTAERAIFVDTYTLPAFRLTIMPEHSYYLSGARVTGAVEAVTFYGEALAGARVVLRGYIRNPRQLVAESIGTLDAAGRFSFDLALPSDYGVTALEAPVLFDIEAEVTNAAGQRAGLQHSVPVAAQSLLIRAVPESGQIKPGVENALYVLIAYPDGTPAPAILQAALPDGVLEVETDPYGLTVLRLVPAVGLTRVELVAQDAFGRTGRRLFDFAVDTAAPVLLLRAEQAVYQVGETLLLETLAADVAEGSPVYLDVLRANQTVAALSAAVKDGRATFALDPDAALLGSLQLHAYVLSEAGAMVEDTRWVVIESPQRLAVNVSPDREVYAPGNRAQVAIQTTLEGRPTSAVLGISLVDESVYALDTRGTDFARLEAYLARELVTQTVAATAVSSAQDVAARAAWANAPKATYSLEARQALAPVMTIPGSGWVKGLALALLILPTLFIIIVIRGLTAPGQAILGGVWRRVRSSLLILMLTAPLWGAMLAGGLWLLARWVGAWGLLLLSVPAFSLLVVLAIHSWRRRDARLQAALGIVVTYLLLLLVLALILARGGVLSGWWIAGIVTLFLLLVIGMALLGQGLLLNGYPGAGWSTTALALLLIPLVMYLTFIPELASPLTTTLGDSTFYAGPLGWLTGCAASPTMEVKEVEVVPAPTQSMTEEALPGILATPTPVASEPFPLRQVFPETLYWNPNALTDENGQFSLEITLPDQLAAWRGIVLASTYAGDIGTATFELRATVE